MRYERLMRSASRPTGLSTASFARLQDRLADFNRHRIVPSLGEPPAPGERQRQQALQALEEAFIERARTEIAPSLAGVPMATDAFVAWFESLRDSGPGQGDSLFPWLAASASFDQMRWFLSQEVAGEAGFDDLVALTQVKMPVRAKLEMARNYWDEMGRGTEKGMHGPMLARLAGHFGIEPNPAATVPEALALGNMMLGLACNRRYAYQSVGALGAIELTAPTRAGYVTAGLRRLGVPARQSHYFALHAVLDLKHSAAWNREVLGPLVQDDPRRARAIAEGALLRLWCGARCFRRYRVEFGITR